MVITNLPVVKDDILKLAEPVSSVGIEMVV